MMTRRTCHRVRLLPLLLVLAAGCASTPDAVWEGAKEYRIRNAGTPVNSAADDLAPSLAADGTLFLTSNRPAADGDEHDRLYYTGPGTTTLRALRPEGGASDEGEGVLTAGGSFEAAFVRCYASGGVGDCDIYLARLQQERLADARNPGFPFNSPEWDSHPSLTADGSAIYFASERFGGLGGSDIWMSKRGSDGAWAAPVNLGRGINTPGDEKAPRISAGGDTLVFSSDYHDGYGGFDFFRCRRIRDAWSKPVNLGRPLNSSADEAFLTKGNGDTLYFCSNRAGGSGGFDIYIAARSTIQPPAEPSVHVAQPLVVRYTAKNAFTLEPVRAMVTFAAPGDEEITVQADAAGRAQSRVRDGVQYGVTAAYPGYASAVDSFFYPMETEGRRERTILLTPILETARQIYSFVVEFDFNLFDIRPEEKRHLDSAVSLLTRYPNSTVVVSGHTDSLGTESYNIRLGYSRAREVSGYVERYLLGKISALRHPIEVRTYGEGQPVAPNGTEEGRQRNRRVEIAVIRNE